MAFLKRNYAKIIALLMLCIVIICYQEVGESNDSRTINNILSIIPKIDSAEQKRISQNIEPLSSFDLYFEDLSEIENESLETLANLQNTLVPSIIEQNISYWVINYTLSDLLYFVSDTVGKDALKHVYKIDYNGYQTPFSTLIAPIYSVDLKGMHSGSMVGVFESKKNDLSIKIMLSAYYTNDEFYGYETFAYDYENDMPMFLEHNKYDKRFDEFTHMHTFKDLDSQTIRSDYIINNRFMPSNISESEQAYDILYNELLLKKIEIFGEKLASDEQKEKHSSSLMSKFRTKSTEIKETYTDKDGVEQKLNFDNNFHSNPLITLDDDYSDGLVVDNMNFILPISEDGIESVTEYSSTSRFVDITCEKNTDVFATEKGIIDQIKQSESGYCLRIKHFSNHNIIYTSYDALNEPTLTVGTIVEKGDKISATKTNFLRLKAFQKAINLRENHTLLSLNPCLLLQLSN